MPKVTEQYRDAKRERILDAARICFLREGFHSTSMQDLFAESGLSSGAFYGYFRSKDDVILAIAERNIGEVLDLLHTLASRDGEVSLGDALAEALELLRTKHRRQGVGTLGVQVWAETARNDRLRARFAELIEGITAELAQVAEQQQRLGSLPTTVTPDAIARVLISVVAGYMVQLATLGPKAVADSPAAVRALWPGAAT